MFKVHFMTIWNYHNEIPLLLVYANSKIKFKK
jgi:hypothetical protein